MKRQRLVSKGSLSRIFQEVAEAWRRQEYAQAIGLLERATHLDPANPQVLLDLGRAYGMRYDYPNATRCLDKAVKVSPHRLETVIEAGRRCHEFGNEKMAQSYFLSALGQGASQPEIFVRLAEFNERGAKLQEATEQVERALAIQADYPRALIARARLHRLAGELEPAEKRLRPFLQGSSPDTGSRVQGWYELGAILDRQGRYDDAMSAFLEAKALLRPAASRFDAILRGIQERVREMEQTISAEVLQRWSAARESLQPARRLAVLCGHPRSGTTLLEQVLDAHPQVLTAEETHILHDEAYLPLSRGFADNISILQVLEAAPVSALLRSRQEYFRCVELFLGQAAGDRLLVDKNPALNVLIPAVARIFPEAVFLIALRDPRDVCLSCFMQPLTLNPVSSAYLTLEGTTRQYASVMGFWRTLLPRLQNRWIEIRYEDLVDNLEEVSRRTLQFLGLEWNAGVTRFHEHARTRQVRSPSYAEVSRPLYRTAIGRWRAYEKHLQPWLPQLEPFLKAGGYS